MGCATRDSSLAGATWRGCPNCLKVHDIGTWHERPGLSPDEIALDYGLALADVYAALTYYHDHRAEIDASIEAGEAFVADLRRKTPSRLLERLRGEWRFCVTPDFCRSAV